LAALLLVPPGVYLRLEQSRARWRPPAYDAQACYGFLTSTASIQSDEPHFPSALRGEGELSNSCATGGCHQDTRAAWLTHAHASAGTNPAYLATLQSFVGRRGEEAGRWCRGCHEPAALAAGDVAAPNAGVTCAACHSAETTHNSFGSAALVLRPERPGPAALLEAALLPKAHARRNLQPGFHASAEFCGACHRKNWNLPQNNYQWMPGPDEYIEWHSSAYSGSALLAPGERREPKACLGCHDAHGHGRPSRASNFAPLAPLTLDLFLRRSVPGGEEVRLLEEPTAAGFNRTSPILLDIVIANTGIGHSFPFGMPDLHDAWLEVKIHDPRGRLILADGQPLSGGTVGGDPQVYRLRALDRQGKPALHGNLDEMVAVEEWRRIPSGEADLARYRLEAPLAEGTSVTVRMLRERRPEFSRWAGERPLEAPTVLAETARRVGDVPVRENRTDTAARWRRYGAALAAVRAYPAAIGALRTALGIQADDPETLLALGRVYLDEGDLIAAHEQFASAERHPEAAERARAWEAAVLRRRGQPEAAAALLEPLVRKHPRDRRLRFELAQTYMLELRHRDAAAELEALLAVDPLDGSAHYNLMLCRQRLNQLSEARKSETVWRLLTGGEPGAGQVVRSVDDRLLRVRRLERPAQ
jgi:hypothetical protein